MFYVVILSTCVFTVGTVSVRVVCCMLYCRQLVRFVCMRVIYLCVFTMVDCFCYIIFCVHECVGVDCYVFISHLMSHATRLLWSARTMLVVHSE